MQLFTHYDLDGAGALVLASKAWRDSLTYTSCGIKSLDEEVDKYLEKNQDSSELILIVDLSVGDDVAERLDERGKVLLLDHHKDIEIEGKYDWVYVDQKRCGTKLLYDFLTEKGFDTGRYYERFVNIIDRWDRWLWAKNDERLPLRLQTLYEILGEDNFVKRFVKNPSLDFSKNERFLIKAMEDQRSKYFWHVKDNLREVSMKVGGEKCKVGAVFADQYHSLLAHDIFMDFPYLDIVAIMTPRNSSVSLRTQRDDLDVSKMAKVYGGGGHPGASGYYVSDNFIKSMVFGMLNPENKRDSNEEGS